MTSLLAAKRPPPKRTLRHDSNTGRSGALPGVCRFLVEPVGSTLYTTAIYIYVHLDGREEPERGCMAFTPYFSDARTVVWIGKPYGFGWVGLDFEPQVWAIGRHLAESLPERSPMDYLFLVMSTAQQELDQFRQALRFEVRAHQHYIELLATQQKPQAYKNPKLNETPEQLAKLREGWAHRLPRTEQRITDMLTDSRDRRAMLESVVLAARHVCAHFEPTPKDMRRWFDDALHRRRSFLSRPYTYLYGFY